MRGDEAEVWIGEGTLTRAEREHQRAVYHRYPGEPHLGRNQPLRMAGAWTQFPSFALGESSGAASIGIVSVRLREIVTCSDFSWVAKS